MSEAFAIINKIDDCVTVVVFDRLHAETDRPPAFRNSGEDLLRSIKARPSRGNVDEITMPPRYAAAGPHQELSHYFARNEAAVIEDHWAESSSNT